MTLYLYYLFAFVNKLKITASFKSIDLHFEIKAERDFANEMSALNVNIYHIKNGESVIS